MNEQANRSHVLTAIANEVNRMFYAGLLWHTLFLAIGAVVQSGSFEWFAAQYRIPVTAQAAVYVGVSVYALAMLLGVRHERMWIDAVMVTISALYAIGLIARFVTGDVSGPLWPVVAYYGGSPLLLGAVFYLSIRTRQYAEVMRWSG